MFSSVEAIEPSSQKLLGWVQSECDVLSCTSTEFRVMPDTPYTVHKPGKGLLALFGCCGCDSRESEPVLVCDDGDNVGYVRQRLPAVLEEFAWGTSNFSVRFPADASPEQKSSLLAMVFLLAVIYFDGKEGELVC